MPVPLGEAAYRRIRDDIVSCRLAPGQRLTERELAASTGFGVSPVRDALTRLDHEGLVRTAPRKGYRVKPLTIKTVDDLFDFWRVTGPELVRRAVARATDEEIGQAVDGIRELTGLMQEDSPPRELALRAIAIADRNFRLLAEATRNEYILGSYTLVSGELSRVWTLVIDSELLDPMGPAEDFLDWPDALSRRDGDAAAAHTLRYIDQSRDRVLSTLARWPSIITSEVVPIHPAGEAQPHPGSTAFPRR